MNIVPDYKTLLALKRPEEGEKVLTSDTRKIYEYKNKQWVEATPPSLTFYDINKQAYMRMNTFKEKDLFLAKNEVKKWRERNFPLSSYFFMLCHDKRYYTLFKIDFNNKEKFEDVFIECLTVLGDVKSIAVTEEKDAVEFWVADEINAYIGYLFPYDEGVVECH